MEADAKVEAVLSPDNRNVAQGFNLQNNLSKWTKLSPLHKFPLPWGPVLPEEDPNDPHRWFLFRPPFFGFLFSEDFVTLDVCRANDMELHSRTNFQWFISSVEVRIAP